MPDLDPELTLDPETAYFLALKAREYNAKVPETDPDGGSNATDDRDVEVLESRPDDAVTAEFAGAIAPLNTDQKLDLIALAWIGRGDFTFAEWREARDAAREVTHLTRYLLDMPALDDYLADALDALGHSLEDYLAGHGEAANPVRIGDGSA